MGRPAHLPEPSPRAITEAEEAMLWLRWLEPELGKLVWARASGTEWKPICWQFGISRPTAHRRWEYALSVIVWATKRASRADEAVAAVCGGGRSERLTALEEFLPSVAY